MNDWVYQIASFMQVRNPVTWRWSHARHHTDTIIVGRDAEIAVMRPPDLLQGGAGCSSAFWTSAIAFPALVRNAFGRLSPDEKSYHPRDGVAEGGRRRALARGDLSRDDRAGARISGRGCR